MTDIGLRPRSATELVDAAFQVYRRTPVQFIVAAALIYVPWLVIQLVFDLEITPARFPSLDVLAINLVAGVVVYVILGGAIAVLARDVYFDRPPDVAAAFQVVGARLVPLVFASLMVLAMTSIGLVLLFLPALYPIARFFATRQAVVLENAGAGTALSRSSVLSVGLKRHILATLFLAGILTLAVNIGATLVAGLIPSAVVQRTIGTVLGVCLRPFFSITETLLYYDVRIRKEAFDIEYLAGADGALAATPNPI